MKVTELKSLILTVAINHLSIKHYFQLTHCKLETKSYVRLAEDDNTSHVKFTYPLSHPTLGWQDADVKTQEKTLYN